MSEGVLGLGPEDDGHEFLDQCDEDIWKDNADKIAVANSMSSEAVMDMLQNFMRSQAHAPMTSLSDTGTCYRCGTPVTSRIHERR